MRRRKCQKRPFSVGARRDIFDCADLCMSKVALPDFLDLPADTAHDAKARPKPASDFCSRFLRIY